MVREYLPLRGPHAGFVALGAEMALGARTADVATGHLIPLKS